MESLHKRSINIGSVLSPIFFIILFALFIPNSVSAAHLITSFYATPNPSNTGNTTIYWSSGNGSDGCFLYGGREGGSSQILVGSQFDNQPGPTSGSFSYTPPTAYNNHVSNGHALPPLPRSFRLECADKNWAFSWNHTAWPNHWTEWDLSVGVQPPPQPLTSRVHVNVQDVPSGATAYWEIDMSGVGVRNGSGGNSSYTYEYTLNSGESRWTRLYPGAVYQGGTSLSCSWTVTQYEAAFLYAGNDLTFNLDYNCAPLTATIAVHNRNHSHQVLGGAEYRIDGPGGNSYGGGADPRTVTPSAGGSSYSVTLTKSPAGHTYTHSAVSGESTTYNGSVNLNISPGQWKDVTFYFTPTVIYGCTDPNANNYNSSATANDGSCTYPVYGCTDPNAANYNPSATANQGCTYDDASVVSHTVPSTMNTCESRNVSVTMRNSGSSTWMVTGSGNKGDYNLGTYDNRWGTARVSVGSPVSPGQNRTFSWTITAPCSPGNHSFPWRMVNEQNRWFGQELNRTISVVTPQVYGCTDPNANNYNSSANVNQGCTYTPPTATITASPNPINVNQNSNLNWSSTNATSCTASNGWSGNKQTNSNQYVNPSVTTTYTITCSGPGGTSAPSSATVTVAPNRNLSTSVSGSGSISASGINCPGDCAHTYTNGTWVSLIASPSSGYEFSSWSGACAGQGSSCSVYMDSDKSASANFILSFNYSLSNSGNVSVQKGGVDQYGQTTVTKTLISGSGGVTLSASGLPSGVSASFSNQGSAPTSNSTVTLTVTPDAATGTFPITITGSPLGKTTTFNLTTVDSPALIVSCSASPTSVMLGEEVTLTATAEGGSGTGFTYTWSGSGIPTNPAPTGSQVTVTYSTAGNKTAIATVRDSLQNQGVCSPGASINVQFDPNFEEF